MATFLRNLFLTHWQRKGISIVLALIIWLVVNHSLTVTKTISNIPVRIINIPPGKTIEGLQHNGLMTKRVTLSLVGNKTLLDELTPNDLEVLIDATDKQDEWIASIDKKNLVSLNPEIDIPKGISRISSQSFLIRLTKLATEKLPILITQPIGEAPRDYQFLDVWPYQITVTVSGPEKLLNRLKAQELKLTFNLNDITKAQLDALQHKPDSTKGDEVSFLVPPQWKQISLPLLSDIPFEIDDPLAGALRIDFVRCHLLPIEKPIPVTLYFPSEHSQILNPETCRIAAGDAIEKIYGIDMISEPLYTKGVSRLFVQIVREMLQIAIIATPQNETSRLEWSIQFINPRLLEDRYVAALMEEGGEEDVGDLQPKLREEYLRNRFRSYMNRFQLFHANDAKWELDIELDAQNLIRAKKGL